MLDYLVSSKVRRALLRLLWGRETVGSVSALAREAAVSFAAAHRELEGMLAAGLVSCERSDAELLYRANTAHPQAGLLRQLVSWQQPSAPPAPPSSLYGWLHTLGAPLLAAPTTEASPAAEVVVAEALRLAHADATVARVLPVLLWRRRRELDWDQLVHEATRRNERHTLGFFVELAGALGHDGAMVKRARQLRDHRHRRVKPFFVDTRGRHALAAARRNTPAVARRWGYLMNMGLDSFADTFDKHGAP